MGVSFAGKRALITMKHVGLNVASDPLMNGALLGIKGGLVIAVADDPGMHSSQNEQDSRYYAQFAMVPCLEPRSQQEAYDMTREAFEVSERFHVPVLLRLTTRLSHARSQVTVSGSGVENPLAKATDKSQWLLLPAYARRNYLTLIEKQQDFLDWSTDYSAQTLELPGGAEERDGSLAVITAGLGGNYYDENLEDFAASRNGRIPARLHIGAYPLPVRLIERLCENAERVIIIEEGQPFIEERLRGLLPQNIRITGRLDAGVSPGAAGGVAGTVPRSGELDPDAVRRCLGLEPRPNILNTGFSLSGSAAGDSPIAKFTPLDIPLLPGRPPQLCQGCPHGDSYEAMQEAVKDLDPSQVAITSDIGCYALGASPPLSVPETIVCMGASIGMAKGAAESGIRYALGVIGDSTFLHSGIPGLIDAVVANTPMTIAILDNSTVAMTGCQPTILTSEQIKNLILGTGLKAEHLVELEAKKASLAENATRLRQELEYPGLSVVIFRRECLESIRRRRSAAAAEGGEP